MKEQIIKDYPNYKVLSVGVVKNIKTGRIIKGSTNAKGYVFVRLYKNGKGKTFTMHKLVALAFIDNPENKPQVNHKDGNKQNNNVDNLEWNTNTENQQHAVSTGLRVMTDETKRKIGNANKGKEKSQDTINKLRDSPLSRKIVQLSLTGDFINEYNSIKEAERETGTIASNIVNCCKGNRKTANKFKWIYADEYNR